MEFDKVLAKRELVMEVMMENKREGKVFTPEILDEEAWRAGLERMKL